MAFDWKPVAMVRITAFFITGIGISLGLNDPLSVPDQHLVWPYLWISWLLLFSAFLLATVFQKRVLAGAVALVVTCLSGYLISAGQDERLHPNHLIHVDDNILAVEAEILNFPKERGQRLRTVIRIQSAKTTTGWKPARSKAILYTQQPIDAIPGDRILITGPPKEISSGPNPWDIDYARRMASRNIFHTYPTDDPIRKLPPSDEALSRLRRNISSLQLFCIAQLDRWVQEEKDQALLHALVLGISDQIDDETNAAYAATGTLHVLAVSGLHISLIYGLLMLLLSPAATSAAARWPVAIVSILFLWMYAAITGFSPSVLRAVTMFSIIAISRPWGKRANIWNVLAGSMFMLLVADPSMITRLGFQLSYLAVAGIIWLAPWLEEKLHIRNRMVGWIWSTACVSVAAQLFTMPISLIHFGLFPTYFIPANLMIIPLSNVALVTGLFLTLGGNMPWAGPWGGQLADWTISLMHAVAEFIRTIPGSTIHTTPLSPLAAVILLLALVLAVLFVKHRRTGYLHALSGLIVLLLVIQLVTDIRQRSTIDIEVYQTPRSPTAMVRTSGETIVIGETNPMVDSSAIRLKSHLLSRPLGHFTFIPVPRNESVSMTFGEHEIMYRNGDAVSKRSPMADLLISGSHQFIPYQNMELTQQIVANGVDKTERPENRDNIHFIGKSGYFRVVVNPFVPWSRLP